MVPRQGGGRRLAVLKPIPLGRFPNPDLKRFPCPESLCQNDSPKNALLGSFRSAFPVVRNTLMYLRRRNPVSSATRAFLPTNGRPVCNLTRSRPPVASESSRISSAARCARGQRWIAHSPTCAGDTLVVRKPDRLGRSLRNLLEIAETLHERDVALRSPAEHIRYCYGRGKMLYSVLGVVRTVRARRPASRTVAWDPGRAGSRGARRATSRAHRFPSSGGAQDA